MMRLLLLAAALFLSLNASAEMSPKLAGARPFVYKTVDHRDLRLFVVAPESWQASDRRPAILLFHGGSWTKGGPEALIGQAEYLASRGMVCVLPEYRLLTDESTPPVVCLEDAQSAMRWTRAHAETLGIDPDRIAAGGGSAGGYLAAFLGLMKGFDAPQDDLTISTRPQALVLFNPVLDNGPGGFGYGRIGEKYQAFSPFHNVSSIAPPTTIFLGTRDQIIPVETIRKFQAAMQDAGVRCDAKFYEGEKHSFFNLRKTERGPGKYYDTLIETDRFLASLGWLQGPPTLEVPSR